MSKNDNKNDDLFNSDIDPNDLMDMITDRVLDNPSVVATPKTQKTLVKHRYVNLVSEGIFRSFQAHHKYTPVGESQMCMFVEGKTDILRSVGHRYVIMFGRLKVKSFLLTDESDLFVFEDYFELNIDDIKKKLRVAINKVENHYNDELSMPGDIEWSTFEFSELDFDSIGW